ncbi:MAG: enoyl-CoA hydratase/isomerase family protein, partial [Hyphomicrobiales bacterium]
MGELKLEKFKELHLTREGRLLTVMFNRPERMNSVTPGMHDELEELWHDVAKDDSIHCIILTGAGERAFCAGVDIGGLKAREDSAAEGNGSRSPARSFIGAKRIIANMLEVEQPI